MLQDVFSERAHNFIELFNPRAGGYDSEHSHALRIVHANLKVRLPRDQRIEITTKPGILCKSCPQNPRGFRRQSKVPPCDEASVHRLDRLVRPVLAQVLTRHGVDIDALTVGGVRSLPSTFYAEVKAALKQVPDLKREFYDWTMFD